MLRGRRDRAAVVRDVAQANAASFRALANEVAFYLASPDLLPFWGDAYKIRLAPRRLAGSSPSLHFQLMDEAWKPGRRGTGFGFIKLRYQPESQTLRLDNINTQADPRGKVRKGIGSDLNRRCLLFMAAKRLRWAKTTVFLEGVASYWFGHGYHPTNRLFLVDWDAMADQKVARYWRKEIERSPEGLWSFAQTSVGREALKKHRGAGYIDLQDAFQRRYITRRFNLDEAALC